MGKLWTRVKIEEILLQEEIGVGNKLLEVKEIDSKYLYFLRIF